MGSTRPDISGESSAPPPPHSLREQASHLAELGAMSQLYAHEVNNLLTQVSARAQLALMRPNDPDLAELALRAVGDCCDRINQLAQIFLTPSSTHGISGPNEANAQRGSIASIHARVVGSIRDADRAQFGFELIDESRGHAPDLMPLLLEQVLLNLLLNALRAVHEHPSPTGEAHAIRVHATFMDPPAVCSTWNTPAVGQSPGSMQIIVEDTGIGMSPTQITQLMNGLRVETSARNQSERLTRHGLGMRVCRKLLDTVGGQLRCESTPLQGTRMSIIVPAIRLDASNARAAA